MRGFIEFGVRRPIVGSLLMWFLIAAGFVCLLNLRREFFPKVEADAARIAITYPGASPQEIEESMARKIEDAIVDLEGIKRITTNLAEGRGGIVVEFEDVISIDEGVEDVRVAIDSLNDLPEEAERIRVSDLEPNFPVIMVTLSGDIGEEALKEAARRVKDELRSLSGMGSIVTVGTRGYEIRVDVDLRALQRHGLRLSGVTDVVRAWMAEVPGGTLRTPATNLAIRTMGIAERPDAVRGIPLKATPEGQVVRVGDVATVTGDFRDEQIIRRFNGEPAVSLIVFKKPDEDAIRIAELVRGYVAGRNGDEFRSPSAWSQFKSIATGSDRARGYELGAQGRLRDPLPSAIATHNDLARIIEGRLDLLTSDAIQGAALVLIVMLLFMNARGAWWVMTGIVVSLACTIFLMWTLDITLNLITMFGLIVVVGMLADDAIVVSDIVLQRAAEGQSPEEAAIKGTSQVCWPVVANASTTVVAFLPLAFVGGRIGDLLVNLPIVAAAALGSSVLESLFILPAHMAHAVRGMRHGAKPAILSFYRRFEEWRETRFMATVTRRYQAVVEFCLRNRYVTAAATLALLLVSLGMVAGGRVPFTFLPADDTETVIVDLRLPIGSPLEATRDVVARFEGATRLQPNEIKAISAIVGQSADFETGTPEASAPHVAQLFVELSHVEDRTKHSSEVLDDLRAAVGPLDEVEAITYREITGGPAGADITYQVRGEDRAAARRVADDLRLALREFEGVHSIADDDFSTQRELRVELKPSAAAMGFNVADVATQVRGIIFGLEAHTFSESREDIEVRVRLDEESRQRVDSISDLRIAAPDGRIVPLVEVAHVSEGNAYAAVRRVDRERTITVTADCATGTNPEEITAALAPTLARLRTSFPSVSIREAGRQKDVNEAFASLPYAFVAALAMIYVILAWLFSSYTQPFAVMLAIPFGVIGVVWGHFLMGYQMTFLSLVGFVALTGVVVNNSLILVEFANAERARGFSLIEALTRAGAKRLRPITLTTVTTICGLVPLLLEQSFQARFLIPMAISIGAGLLSATVLTLVFLPANLVIVDDLNRIAYWLWHGRRRDDARPEGASPAAP